LGEMLTKEGRRPVFDCIGFEPALSGQAMAGQL